MNYYWITNKKGNTAEIFLYGFIDPFDVSAGDFVRELRQLEKDGITTINVRINSGGGSVFEGLAIYNALVNSTCTIETYVDGIAASMASIIMLAGSTVHMSKSARVMTHQPSMGSYGTSDEHKKNSQLLDGIEKTMLAIYQSATGKTEAECKAAFMNGKDNWFDAEEAKAAGLISDIYDAVSVEVPKKEKDAKALWAIYNRCDFAAVFNQSNNMKQIKLSAAQLAAMMLNESADEAQVEAKLNDLVAKAAKVDSLTAQLNEANTAKTTAEQALATYKGQVQKDQIAAMLDAAVGKKITVETKAQLAKDYAENAEGLKALLAALPEYNGVVKNLNPQATKVAELVAKGWDALDKAGELEALKAASADAFFDLFKEKFGKPHQEDKR